MTRHINAENKIIVMELEPYGNVERILMKNWSQIVERLKITESELQLNCFSGSTYNRYILKCSSTDDLKRAYGELIGITSGIQTIHHDNYGPYVLLEEYTKYKK